MSVWLFVCPGTDIDPKLVEYTLSLTSTTHLTHLYSTNPCLILLQCYNASYFLWSLNKNSISRSLVSPITTFYETRDPTAANLWNVTLSRHFRLPRLQLPKSSTVQEQVKCEKCPSCDILCQRFLKSNGKVHFGFFHISVGPAKFAVPFLTNRFIIARISLHLYREFEKRNKEWPLG